MTLVVADAEGVVSFAQSTSEDVFRPARGLRQPNIASLVTTAQENYGFAEGEIAGLDARSGWRQSELKVDLALDHTRTYAFAVIRPARRFGVDDPVFPERFGSLTDARMFMDQFRDRYNHQHHHQNLGLHTPADVHYGLATAKANDRAEVLASVRAARPERFGTDHTPRPSTCPTRRGSTNQTRRNTSTPPNSHWPHSP